MLKTGNTQARKTLSWPQFKVLPLRTLFNRQYWWATLVVLLGMAFLARLGVWQLDRLEQRKARNAELIQQLELPPLSLTNDVSSEELTSLKNRPAIVRGEYDYPHQVALLYQNWMDAPGIHLITPLVIEGGPQAVLVDRGWLPFEQADPENWSQFNEPGSVSVTGFIRLSEALPARAGDVPPQSQVAEPQSDWYRVDIEAIQAQMPYELLPVFILKSAPESRDTALPYEIEPKFDLSNGPHLGYAIQWFIFTLILGITYIGYISKKEASHAPSLDGDSPGATKEG